MIQDQYKRRIMERFMTPTELTDFDTKYQSQKVPTANNLGEKTFQQLVSEEVRKELYGKKKRVHKKRS